MGVVIYISQKHIHNHFVYIFVYFVQSAVEIEVMVVVVAVISSLSLVLSILMTQSFTCIITIGNGTNYYHHWRINIDKFSNQTSCCYCCCCCCCYSCFCQCNSRRKYTHQEQYEHQPPRISILLLPSTITFLVVEYENLSWIILLSLFCLPMVSLDTAREEVVHSSRNQCLVVNYFYCPTFVVLFLVILLILLF